MISRLTAIQRSQIAEALTLSRFLTSHSDEADTELFQRRRDRVRAIQQDLQECIHPIYRKPLNPEQVPLEVRRAFVQAALLVSRYFAVGGVGWRGTLPSPTLSQYHPDPVPPHWKTPEGIAEIGRLFKLPEKSIGEIICHVDQVDAEIALQCQLIYLVLDSVGVSFDDPTPQPTEPFVSLFQVLFNGILVHPEHLSVVFTPTQLYFCVDFPPLEDLRQWQALSPPEYQGSLRELHQKLSEFTFQKFKRFPTFGPCNPADINWDWAQQVCNRFNDHINPVLPITPAQLIQRLSKSIGVLPQKDAEMFLVHDIWGHYWQLLFSQFEGDYNTLADCGEALRAQETAYTTEGPLTCRELFHFQKADVWIDEDRAIRFFHGEVRQRLGLLFTHLLGELIADIAEFKFIWSNPQDAHKLPSSSAFTDYPANLDLSLVDLDFLFLRVLQPLLEVHLSPLEMSPLEIELLAASPLQRLAADQVPQLEVNLKRAIAQLHHIFLTEYGSAYLSDVKTENSLFAEIAVNLLQLQNVINTLYTDPQFTQGTQIPFQDLMIVFISRYCSNDSYAEFWKIDNVLADYFVPCWQLLHQM